MKVLLINGSPHEKGCIYTALNEVAGALERAGVSTEIAWLGAGAIQDCTACHACYDGSGRCVFDDDCVNALIDKARGADGFVFGAPVYYAHPSGRSLAALDRMFYAGHEAFRGKPGASVVCARRAGTVASFDVLNKYFTISEMPVVSSTYWNMVHGNTPDEVREDKEGMQIMRILGENMAWLLKSIEAGRTAGLAYPVHEKRVGTNFIR